MLLIRGSVGPRGDHVAKNLNTIGVTIDVDGIYGAGYEKAVKTFQVANAIDADGKYGPATHAKMEELLAQASGPAQKLMLRHLPGARAPGEVGRAYPSHEMTSLTRNRDISARFTGPFVGLVQRQANRARDLGHDAQPVGLVASPPNRDATDSGARAPCSPALPFPAPG